MVRTVRVFDHTSSDLEACFLLSIWGRSRRLLRGLLRVETKRFTQSSQSWFSLSGFSRHSGMKSGQKEIGFAKLWYPWYFTIPHDTLQDLISSMSLLRLLPTLARRQRSRSLFFVPTLSTWLTAGSWYADDEAKTWHNWGWAWVISVLVAAPNLLRSTFDFFMKDLTRSQMVCKPWDTMKY